jgi:hypothetical protein
MGVFHRTAPVLLGPCQPLLGGVELAAGDPHPGRDLPAPGQPALGPVRQVPGHPGQLPVLGPARADRARERGGRRLRQVAEEGQPSLLRRVLVLQLPDQVPQPLHIGAQPRGVLADRVGPEPAAHLDLEQRRPGPAHRDANRRRVRRRRQRPDLHAPEARGHLRRPGAHDPRPVPEDGHPGDRRVYPAGRRFGVG